MKRLIAALCIGALASSARVAAQQPERVEIRVAAQTKIGVRLTW